MGIFLPNGETREGGLQSFLKQGTKSMKRIRKKKNRYVSQLKIFENWKNKSKNQHFAPTPWYQTICFSYSWKTQFSLSDWVRF